MAKYLIISIILFLISPIPSHSRNIPSHVELTATNPNSSAGKVAGKAAVGDNKNIIFGGVGGYAGVGGVAIGGIPVLGAAGGGVGGFAGAAGLGGGGGGGCSVCGGGAGGGLGGGAGAGGLIP